MQVDAVIAGNGPTGRLAYRALRDLGLETVVVAPAPRPGPDPRTTALLPVSIAALDRLGVDVRAAATPLPQLTIETTGPLGLVSERFSADDVDCPYLALNVPIGDLTTLLPVQDAIEATVSRVDYAGGRPAVVTDTGARIGARLVVAADGLASPTRDAARIRMHRQGLGLSAYCAPVTLQAAHGGLCIERYDDVGSVTVIPVGERDGSLISICGTEAVNRLAELPAEEVAGAIAARQPAYGSLRLTGPAAIFPLSIGWATSPARRRVVAVGEAAHTVPPIGAQGWNMAVRDVMALHSVLAETLRVGGDIGAETVLARYARNRRTDLVGRISAVGLLAGVATNPIVPVQLMRQIGLGALSRLPGLKRGLMRAGLG
ncbi:MAG: FAD-dependent monooxygenase [Thalassobaculum sp.]